MKENKKYNDRKYNELYAFWNMLFPFVLKDYEYVAVFRWCPDSLKPYTISSLVLDSLIAFSSQAIKHSDSFILINFAISKVVSKP